MVNKSPANLLKLDLPVAHSSIPLHTDLYKLPLHCHLGKAMDNEFMSGGQFCRGKVAKRMYLTILAH